LDIVEPVTILLAETLTSSSSIMLCVSCTSSSEFWYTNNLGVGQFLIRHISKSEYVAHVCCLTWYTLVVL